MDWKTVFTISATLLVAGTGYVYNLRLARRRDQLERRNRQLSDFYGPLFALTRAGDAAWETFRERYRPGREFWTEPFPSAEEADAWRLWMTTVFMPLNRQMMDLVVSRADLLEESAMPECLLDLCAHVASYEAILKRWERNDYAENKPRIRFPRAELRKYSSSSFEFIKRNQASLLGHAERSDYLHLEP